MTSVNIISSLPKNILKPFHRVSTGHKKICKSWNFIKSLFRPEKSWTLGMGRQKSTIYNSMSVLPKSG